MKVTVSEITNKIGFIHSFRKIYNHMSLQEVLSFVNSLPYIIEVSSETEANEIKNSLNNYAKIEIEEEEEIQYDPRLGAPVGFNILYNCNINPPQEYIDAMAWHDSLSEKEKEHINQIILWRSRPAVC